MFINKKLLLALACTPLFTACIVNGDDDDTAGNTDTDPSTTVTVTASTTAGTEDTSASATVSTSVGTEESGSESGGTQADTGSTGDTDTGGGGMACVQGCEEPVDCCGGEPTCEGAVGDYPYNYTCDAGVCGYGEGCAVTDDCEAVYPGLGYECIVVEGYGYCELPCTADEDCTAPFTCVDDGAGAMSCQFLCTEDADCGTGTCEADGSCTAAPCEADADCLAGGVCDTATGACGCADSTECAKGYTCAG